MRPSSAWQQFIFRHRGLALAFLGLWVLGQARPTLCSVKLGLFLGVAGELIRIWAIGYTGQISRGLEPGAHRLMTAGPYSLVRNPLYVGNVLNGLGVLVAASGGLSIQQLSQLWFGVLAGLVLLYSSLICVEEEFLSAKFGQEYLEYSRRVPALCPRSLRVAPGTGSFSWTHGVRWESTTLLWWGFTWALLFAMSLRHSAVCGRLG